jgi:hypothetical protein
MERTLWPEFTGCGVILEYGVAIAVGVREPLAVLRGELDLSKIARHDIWRTRRKRGAGELFGRHSIFAILEPSGNGLPSPGTPFL